MRRSRYNPATIARDVLLATGKHPDLDPLNNHLDILKTTLANKQGRGLYKADHSLDLLSIRWDVLDPGDPIESLRLVVIEAARARQIPPETYLSDGDDESDDPSPSVRRDQPSARPAFRPNMEGGSTAVMTVAGDSPLRTLTALKRKRGRPPLQNRPAGAGAANQTPNAAARPGATTRTPHTAPAAAGGASSSATAGAPTGYTALRAAQALSGGGEGVKKRGRPVGWRMAIHYKGDNPAAANGKIKGKGKPGASAPGVGAGAAAEAPRPEVNHKTFSCKWRGCAAKLHNLDTLRRHVRKIHGLSKNDKTLECRWEGCGKKVSIMDPRTGSIGEKHQYLSFGDFGVWTNHIEQSHLGPIGWLRGDGPAAGFSGTNIPYSHFSPVSDE